MRQLFSGIETHCSEGTRFHAVATAETPVDAVAFTLIECGFYGTGTDSVIYVARIPVFTRRAAFYHGNLSLSFHGGESGYACDFFHSLRIDSRTGKPFSDKMRYIFIQTPLFNKKSEEECVSEFDQWMYNLINMPNMESMAFINQKKLFDQFDKIASYATLSDSDRMAYDADLKAYRDLRGQLEYAEAKGRKEGEAKGRKEGEEKGEAKMIREMARQGIGIDTIATIAKMTVDKIRRIIAAADDDA